MRNIKVEKSLAVGIILLFVGTGIIPAIAQDTENPLPTSRGNWLYVGGSGPGNYTKIQDAIDNASDGDTVFVYDDSSPYYENVFVNKSISVLGENRDTTIIDAKGHRSVLVLQAEGIIVTGLTLQHSGGVGWNDSGIRIKNNGNAIITLNIFTNNDVAILCMAGNDISITNNVIIDNEWGIRFSDWDTATIAHNIINNSREGIRTNDCINIFIYNNKIMNHIHGIVLCSDGKIEVQYNYIEKNDYGISVSGRNALIYNNAIINNIIGLNIWGRQNIIKQNNLINNTVQATFTYERSEIIANLFSLHIKMNTIINNYWENHSSSSPKQIEGRIILWHTWDELEWEWKAHSITWYTYDYYPAQEPYDIPEIR
ncbi:MAG: right-handed parallel beta-helix repeat-containing protein [Thermoplasmata archaeon]|nr:right-handed parallel beta-helix repeat-containing protein [Thermoplasmata archaeon]